MFRRQSREQLTPYGGDVRRSASPVSIRTLRERGGGGMGGSGESSPPVLPTTPSTTDFVSGKSARESMSNLFKRSGSPLATTNRVPLVTTSFFNRPAAREDASPLTRQTSSRSRGTPAREISPGSSANGRVTPVPVPVTLTSSLLPRAPVDQTTAGPSPARHRSTETGTSRRGDLSPKRAGGHGEQSRRHTVSTSRRDASPVKRFGADAPLVPLLPTDFEHRMAARRMAEHNKQRESTDSRAHEETRVPFDPDPTTQQHTRAESEKHATSEADKRSTSTRRRPRADSEKHSHLASPVEIDTSRSILRVPADSSPSAGPSPAAPEPPAIVKDEQARRVSATGEGTKLRVPSPSPRVHKSAHFAPSPTKSPTKRSRTKSRNDFPPDANCLSRVKNLQNSPDRYRDDILISLWDEIKVLPNEPQARNDPHNVSTGILLMDALRKEMHLPLKDVAHSMNGSSDALRRMTSVCHGSTAANKPEAIVKLCKLNQDRDRLLKGVPPEIALLKLVAESISDPEIEAEDHRFMDDAFALLSNGLTAPTISKAVRDVCINANVLVKASEIMCDPDSPASLKAAVGEFISHFNETPAGHAYLQQHHPEIVPLKGQPQNLEVMMRVVQRKVRNSKRQPEDLQSKSLRSLDTSLAPETTAEDLKALVKALDTKEVVEDPVAARRFADLCVTYATRKRTKELREAGAHELLLKMMRNNAETPEVVARCLDGFAEMADNDLELAEFCAARVPPAVDMPAVVDDETCVRRYIGLLEDLAVYGDPALVAKMAKNKILADLEMAEQNTSDSDTILVDSIQSVRVVFTDKAEPLTLRDVYGFLMTKQSNDDSINIQEDRAVRRMFRFVCRKTAEYGRDQEIDSGVFGFIGSEFMYGCLSFQVLASVEDNRKVLKLMQIPKLLLECMKKQGDAQIAQHAVLTAVELADEKELAQEFVKEEWRRELIVDILKRGREASEEDPYNEVEDLVGSRVQLIEKTATDRDVYKDTKAVSELLNTWDDYDFYFYGNVRVRSKEDLKAIFKQDKKTRGGVRTRLARRASHFFHHTEEDAKPSLEMNRGITQAASPLERRQSLRSPIQQGVGQSPLERRKSVVGPDVLGKAKLNGSTSRKGGNLASRASQFFSSAKTGKREDGPKAAAGSIAIARRQSMIPDNNVNRRGSFFARKPVVPAVEIPSRAEPGARASHLQRRASMANPLADLEDGPARHVPMSARSNASIGLHDVDSMVSGGAQSFRSEGSTLWGDIDFDPEESGVFVPRMLEHVFKALRATVTTENFFELYTRGCVLRLVGIIACPETPPGCFAHALYLVGMLAPYQDCKDLFGEGMAIEKICSLLRRAYKQRGTHVSETVTNACLAIATLVVVHLPNTRRFAKKRGTELNVDVLRTRGAYNDSKAVNAASALMSNLCFKNSEMKDRLGEDEACEALVKAMASYEGNAGEANSRCVASLFKAVGNLSLNIENMKKFMDADIDKAYASFMGEADEELDNTTIESCLRTLSNLVIEKDNMQRFSIVIIPFLSLLRKERHTSAEVHRWAFITLANLCRWPDNASSFVKNAGVDTITMLLPYLEESPALWASVIVVLGIQTTHPNNIPILLDTGIFKLLADTLNKFVALTKEHPRSMDALNGIISTDHSSEEEIKNQTSIILQYSQLPISALRCAHRVLTEKRAAEDCVNEGVFELAQSILKISSYQPMLAYECLRVIFATMSLYGGEALIRVTEIRRLQESDDTENETLFYDPATDWGVNELQQLEEGCSPTGSSVPYTDPTEPEWQLVVPPQVERDYAPRIWEQLKMASHMRELTEMVRDIASSPRNLRNIRLQRMCLGFLAFVATERVAIPSLFRRLDVPIDPDTAAPQEEVMGGEEDADPDNAFHSPIRRRRSIWEAFKRVEKKDEKQGGFGRERKPDPTSIIDIIGRTISNLWYDQDCLDEMCILLNSMIFLCFGREELCALLGDVDIYKQLNSFLDRLPADKVKPYWIVTCKNFRRFLQTQGKLFPDGLESDVSYMSDLQSTLRGSLSVRPLMTSKTGTGGTTIKKKTIFTARDLALMKNLCLDEYPLALSQWNIDPFPDGVMSLTADTRAKLRKGGKVEVYQRDGSRLNLLWKAAHDLVLFQWKILPLDTKEKDELDPTYPFDIAASRFTNLSPHVNFSFFDRPVNAERSVQHHRCCSLAGPATPSVPQGVSLILRFKDQSARDHFLTNVSNWREACAFGFL